MKFKVVALITLSVIGLAIGLKVAINAKGRSNLIEPRELTAQEDATPIQRGVMTEKQRAHGRLYEDYTVYSRGLPKIPDQVKSSVPEVLITVEPPLHALSRDPNPSSAVDFLRELACRSDAVILGTVKSKTSQLTSEEDFVFTDYEMNVNEVLKSSQPLQPQSTVTVTYPGGVVLLNGKRVRALDESYQLLKSRHQYVLFLKFVPATGAYKPISSTGNFGIAENQVFSLTKEPLPLREDLDVPQRFISDLRIALGSDCK